MRAFGFDARPRVGGFCEALRALELPMPTPGEGEVRVRGRVGGPRYKFAVIGEPDFPGIERLILGQGKHPVSTGEWSAGAVGMDGSGPSQTSLVTSSM